MIPQSVRLLYYLAFLHNTDNNSSTPSYCALFYTCSPTRMHLACFVAMLYYDLMTWYQ